MLDLSGLCEFAQLLDDRWADDPHFGARLDEAPHLARGYFAATHHDAAAAGDVEKYRNVCHRFCIDPNICAARQTVARRPMRRMEGGYGSNGADKRGCGLQS